MSLVQGLRLPIASGKHGTMANLRTACALNRARDQEASDKFLHRGAQLWDSSKMGAGDVMALICTALLFPVLFVPVRHCRLPKQYTKLVSYARK